MADYNTQSLCLDIAMGEMAYAEMGVKHGITAHYVGMIARGDKRPELQLTIKACRDGFLEDAKGLASLAAREAMVALRKIATTEVKGVQAKDVQRKACVDILKFSLGDPSKTDVNINNQPGATFGRDPDDEAEFREFQAAKLGGPPADDDGKPEDGPPKP